MITDDSALIDAILDTKPSPLRRKLIEGLAMYTSRSEQDELTLADVGFRICQLRRERNLSQLQLAELVGVARTTVTVWEGGNAEMNLTKLFKIAKALNCDVRELLTDHPTDFDKRRAELAAIRIINSLLR